MKEKIKIVVCAILSAISLCISGKFSAIVGVWSKFATELKGETEQSFAIVILLIIVYSKIWRKYISGRKCITHILAVCFAICMLIGKSFSQMGNIKFIFGDKKQFCIAIIVFLGFYILFDVAITALYVYISEKRKREEKAIKVKWIEEHYFTFSFLCMLICWSPYILCYLPGSVPHDGYWQLNMAFGINPLTNHHPWVITFIYGIIMRLGRCVSDNFGIFMIVISFTIIEILCYAFVCISLKKWGASKKVYIGALVFFSIVPVFGGYAQAVIKDNIFSALLALFFTIYIDICMQHETAIGIKKMIALFLVGILVCLSRNNGVYVVIPSMVCLILYMQKEKSRYVIFMICLVVCYQGIEGCVAPKLGVEKGSVKEMLSIPFQQTARYIKEYPDEVTLKEKNVINAVLSYDGIKENYNPELSDFVKNTFREESEDKLSEYFKIWFEMFLKHPMVYVEATLNNTFAYYYPFYNQNVLGNYQFYIKEAPVATGYFDIHYIMPVKIRATVTEYVQTWNKIPGISQIVNSGFYTWILLLLVGYLIYTKRIKGILLLIGPAINILVCIASPVNGLLRYAFPLMACTPLLIYWAVCVEEYSGDEDVEF